MSKEVKYSKEFKLDTKSIARRKKSQRINANTLFKWRKRYQLHGNKDFQAPDIRLPKNELQEAQTTKERRHSAKNRA